MTSTPATRGVLALSSPGEGSATDAPFECAAAHERVLFVGDGGHAGPVFRARENGLQPHAPMIAARPVASISAINPLECLK